MKITVAIPIYNAARHLKVTLDSLINQTMNASDFEIICVNDCSTDNSVDVIRDYQKKMNNLNLINREVNSGGPMIPRNDAIDAAKGDYILFLDNDDFLGEETLERFYREATTHNSDVIYGKYVGVNGRNVPQSMFKKGNRPNADIIEDSLVFSLAPHKMFKMSFLREYDFKFHPKAVVGEDQLFVMQCYLYAKVITVLSDYEYYYVVARGDENLSLKYFPAEQFYVSFNRIMENIETSPLDDIYKAEVKIAFLNRFLRASRLRGNLLSKRLNKEQKKDWLSETKTFFDKFIDEYTFKNLTNLYKYFVQVVRENDIDKLLAIHKHIEKVTSNEVTRVEDGEIYARLVNISKHGSYDEEHVVNQSNVSEVFINTMDFKENGAFITGQISQTLLINFKVNYNLILVHRETGIEKVIKSVDTNHSNRFGFTFDYAEILFDEKLTGPWDLFIEGTINGYDKRRRIGSNRDSRIKKHKEIKGYQSFGRTYSINPYYTTPHDNISLDVKVQ